MRLRFPVTVCILPSQQKGAGKFPLYFHRFALSASKIAGETAGTVDVFVAKSAACGTVYL